MMQPTTPQSPDAVYAAAVRQILAEGTPKHGRAHPTVSATGVQMRFDLRRGFPLLEHKRVPFRLVATELAWFLAGRTDVGWLQDRNVHIWDDDAAKMTERGFDYAPGDLGPVYGAEWRGTPATSHRVDQIAELRRQLKANPLSRRHVVSAWIPDDVPKMGLPPCHLLWQVLLNDGQMDLVLTMRSGDFGLGVPFNIASYALLLELLAAEVGATARLLVVTVGDAHVYTDHVEPLQQRLDEAVDELDALTTPPPRLALGGIDNVDAFVAAHEADPAFKLEVRHYSPRPKLALALHT